MKVLIACEESQAVTIEFRKLGFEAYSCDILEQSGGHPEWHFKGNILDILNGMFKCKCGYLFEYGCGKYGCCSTAKLIEWDCMVAFPPCTDLAMSGAKHFEQKRNDGRQQKSIEFFLQLVNAPIPFIAIENPIGVMSSFYRKPDQIINPFDFGDPARKPTCLWLKNLPKLKSTNFGDAPLFGETLDKGEFHTTKGGKTLPKWYNLPPSENRAKIRSKTFPGIAKAMANQWGQYLIKQLKQNDDVKNLRR
jgi:hypothetical protein